MDPTRRTLLTTGAAAAAVAVVPRVFAQQPSGERNTPMPVFEKGNVRIHYEEVGSGFPLIATRDLLWYRPVSGLPATDN